MSELSRCPKPRAMLAQYGLDGSHASALLGAEAGPGRPPHVHHHCTAWVT